MKNRQPRICFQKRANLPMEICQMTATFRELWDVCRLLSKESHAGTGVLVSNSTCVETHKWFQLMMSLPANLLHKCSLIVLDKCTSTLVPHSKHMWYRLRLATVICSAHQQQNELIQSKQFIGDVTRSITVFTRWVSSRLVLALDCLFRLSVIYFMLTALLDVVCLPLNPSFFFRPLWPLIFPQPIHLYLLF